MSKGKQRVGQCAYCGKTAEITRDHVVPLTLFTHPYPPNLITVPSCAECNNVSKSHGDTDLRDYLGLDLFGNQSKSGQAVFPKVLRANERGQSALARKAALSSEMRPLYTSAGIYLGDYPTARLDEGTIEGPLATIVRGLYFYGKKERIPDNYEFDVRRVQEWEVPQFLQSLNPLQASTYIVKDGPHFYGEVFSYMCFGATEDRFTTLWLMWFFGRVLFFVSTEPV